MYVSKLSLQHFRIYQALNLDLPRGTTLFYGSNAAGKTTLLEALYYLATTRSPRASAERELVSLDATGDLGLPPFARLSAKVEPVKEADPLLLEIMIQRRFDAEGGLAPASQKLIRVNRINRRAIDLIGQLRVVMFAPQDLVLLTGAPADRRRYLDVTLSQIDGHYVRSLSRYNQVLSQRNGLLRSWREQRRGGRHDQELSFWDDELTKAGAYLLRERRRAVAALSELTRAMFADITASDLPFALAYVGTTEAVDAAAFAAALRANRREELDRGMTLIGPHRDDLSITLGGREVGAYGSRGQQRSATLALRLAEAELMRDRTGDCPVLLLDDLLSELDSRRRDHLLRTIDRPDQQTLITATDLDDFAPAFLAGITRMHVEQGKVFPA
ncbi:MAG TPA: DNA replication/repair protein RecF [Herpetosiphonaceae bacterium]